MPHIQDPTIGRSLQRGLRLTALPDSVLAPEVVPVIVVADFTGGQFGDVVRGCHGSINQIGVAAEQSHGSVRRASIGTEVIVKGFDYSGPTNLQLIIARLEEAPPLGLTESNEKQFDDFDTPGRPSAILETGTFAGVDVPQVNILARHVVLANVRNNISFGAGLRLGTPGTFQDQVFCFTLESNVTCRFNFVWEERPPLG